MRLNPNLTMYIKGDDDNCSSLMWKTKILAMQTDPAKMGAAMHLIDCEAYKQPNYMINWMNN